MHRHTNRLIQESSPYLQQHAHNPVDWHPWCPEALERAKAEGKPILLSIGYAACHWCHVMERESFEDEAVAEVMNRHFVNIKIDREERPDLDHIYMDAVQAMTGSGGWPLNVFLTPDARPFYGGTYFPPVRVHNRPSWTEVLQGIATAFRDRRQEIEDQAAQLLSHLQNASRTARGGRLEGAADAEAGDPLTAEQAKRICEALLQSADTVHGGFGRAPKFPQTFSIRFLLRYHHLHGDEASLRQASLSLRRMMQGGIFDQVGGGFARYSTDAEWLAPHFEKMAYDNALLVSVLSEAYQVTGAPDFAGAIRRTVAFMQRELMDEDGCFLSALDADSEGEEGRFYTWSKEEVVSLLGADAERFCAAYDITDTGNWEGVNIPRLLHAPTEASEGGVADDGLRRRLDHCLAILLQARSERVRPQTDDKRILGWNALMNTALCKAYAALGDASLLEGAVRNMEALELRLYDATTDEWRHTFKEGTARFPAFLDDLALLIEALSHLHEATGDTGLLRKAERLTEKVMERFGAAEPDPFFFYTPDFQDDVIVRRKELQDGALPSGNAVMAGNLHRLSLLCDRPEWGRRARAMVEAMLGPTLRYPNAFGLWAGLLQEMADRTWEVVVVGDGAREAVGPFLRRYAPHRVLLYADKPDPTLPLFKGKAHTPHPTWYLCKGRTCLPPLKSLEEVMETLGGAGANMPPVQ